MKVLFAASQDSPSYRVRAEQIAAQRPEWRAQIGIGGHEAFDVVVFVKRFDLNWRAHIKAPIVLDVLDFWRQPFDDVFEDEYDAARGKLREHVEALDPYACIAATQAMAADLAGWRAPGRVKAIPHHWNPVLKPGEIRESARHICYEGTVAFLGEWMDALASEAERLGARFVTNPPDLGMADILISARGKHARSVYTRRWKSGVKTANMIGAGVPGIAMWEHGAAETVDASEWRPGDGSVSLVSTWREMRNELHRLMDLGARKEMRAKQDERRDRFSVAAVADQYESFLASLVQPESQKAA